MLCQHEYLLLQQFLVGNDLQSCLEALTSENHDNLHLMERINVDLQVQNSIVPTAYSLARFKVSGHLPALQVNLSDTKYKSLMRIVDVAIPNLDDEHGQGAPAPTGGQHPKSAFRLPSAFFGTSGPEYNIDDGDKERKPEEPTQGSAADEGDEFFEAEQGDTKGVRCGFIHEQNIY